ncbi:MAG: VanZ family protein [Candidatus Omnitrophota bacterium]
MKRNRTNVKNPIVVTAAVKRMANAWAYPCAWALIILFFSVLPCANLPSFPVGNLDKIAHFVEFAVLSALIIRTFNRLGKIFSGRSVVFTLILGAGYGILVELIQRFVPGRNADLYDAVFNTAGVVFGIAIGIAVGGIKSSWRK